MTIHAGTVKTHMDLAGIPGTSLKVSRVALGTWAIGGWMWGGTDEAESIATIRAAVEHGINVIDTAPVYGFGRSEEIVGKAIAEAKLRSRVVIATKTGLGWQNGKVFRNASALASCRRSRTRCAGFAPITSTPIRSTGPIR
jgi:aryl-alcohol dehydrogenase-like predicted oxidoreductase